MVAVTIERVATAGFPRLAVMAWGVAKGTLVGTPAIMSLLMSDKAVGFTFGIAAGMVLDGSWLGRLCVVSARPAAA